MGIHGRDDVVKKRNANQSLHQTNRTFTFSEVASVHMGFIFGGCTGGGEVELFRHLRVVPRHYNTNTVLGSP